MVLLDSNILIYAGKAEFSSLQTRYINAQASVSIVSKVEVLGYQQLNEVTINLLQSFFNIMDIIELSDEIASLAIFLRQQRKITLGDAIIAATALIEDKTLITANTKDFSWINGLSLINPMS